MHCGFLAGSPRSWRRIVVAWQALVAWGVWNDSTEGLARVGPGNLAGRLALWGISQRGLDVLAIVIALAMAAAALAARRTSAARAARPTR